ncbi:hypothetical protein SELMODRAFT_421799 [Selaginella moellendorffii]|uniref:Bet v I/Major latex protein domain-containing protein n=1 Tax=Selaginella moellendorffii TaxID=88036 RepID=D8SGE2_SELML|nr:hypothetical protein SELMODRAFT_421799 [Selaginella moellendorffii]
MRLVLGFVIAALVVARIGSATPRHGLDESAVDREKDRSDPELNRALDEFMDLVAQHRVVIVGKKDCTMTNRVKAAMSEQGEKPHFIDIDHTKSDEAWMIQKALRRWLGYWITPQVFVNGMHYGGAESMEVCRAEVELDVSAWEAWQTFKDAKSLAGIIPGVIQSVEYLVGGGEAGTIRLVGLKQDGSSKVVFAKERLKLVDDASMTIRYTMLENCDFSHLYSHYVGTLRFHPIQSEPSKSVVVWEIECVPLGSAPPLRPAAYVRIWKEIEKHLVEKRLIK